MADSKCHPYYADDVIGVQHANTVHFVDKSRLTWNENGGTWKWQKAI
jgi:hypothetical protein